MLTTCVLLITINISMASALSPYSKGTFRFECKSNLYSRLSMQYFIIHYITQKAVSVHWQITAQYFVTQTSPTQTVKMTISRPAWVGQYYQISIEGCPGDTPTFSIIFEILTFLCWLNYIISHKLQQGDKTVN